MEKIKKINRIKVFIISFIFTGFLVTGLVLHIKKTISTYYIKLFFTNHLQKELLLEKREFQKHKSKTENIKKTLTELTYGPLTYRYEPILSHNAKILHVWLQGNFLYVNINEAAFKDKYNTSLAVHALNRTIFHNFPSVKYIKYLIDGNSVPTVTGFENLGIIYTNFPSKK